MSRINIIKADITTLEADAIVNATNSGLLAGGGVCGAIFKKAGYEKLTAACDKIGHCDVGKAVITPGFLLKAKHVIHAVGPIWTGGNNNEPALLKSAYQNSLRVALENGCKTIAFPLISAGIYGYPKEKAWEAALNSCADFLGEHPSDEINITFAVIDDGLLDMGESVLTDIKQNN